MKKGLSLFHSDFLLGTFIKAFQKGLSSFHSDFLLGTFIKAFQKYAMRTFCFFNAHRFTKASFRHRLALKKPVTFVTGFVIRIGFEPMALILEGWRSIQLSYRTVYPHGKTSPWGCKIKIIWAFFKENLTQIGLHQSFTIKSRITTLATVQPKMAGI